MFHGGQGRKDGSGYVTVQIGGTPVYIHRFAHTLWVGPIPADMTVDHVCGNKRCVRPGHLQLLSTGDNSRRYWREQRTMCRNGLHPISESVEVQPWKSGPRAGRTVVRCVPCFDENTRRNRARDASVGR